MYSRQGNQIGESEGKMGKNGESLDNSAAISAFQDALKLALDTHHPQWELGYKGKGRGTQRYKFKTVLHDTLESWVYAKQFQQPQQKTIEEFLSEADFPEETRSTILKLYVALKRKPRQRKQRKPTPAPFVAEPSSPSMENHSATPQGRLKNPGWLVAMLGILLLGSAATLLVGFLHTFSASPTAQNMTAPSGIIPYPTIGNASMLQRSADWCIILAVDVTLVPHSATPTFDVYFSRDAPIDKLGKNQLPEGVENYFYFSQDINRADDTTYIQQENANFLGMDSQKNQWVYQVQGKWSTAPEGWNNPSWWRIDYKCGSLTPSQ